MSDWRDLWEERGRCYPHEDAIKLGGFDHGAGKLNDEQVNYLIQKIKSNLNLSPDDFLLEVGCGAGMLLGPLSTIVRRVVGVDYASSMVERCRNSFPHLEIMVGEAGDLSFPENTFDKIVCFSVFQYFSS